MAVDIKELYSFTFTLTHKPGVTKKDVDGTGYCTHSMVRMRRTHIRQNCPRVLRNIVLFSLYRSWRGLGPCHHYILSSACFNCTSSVPLSSKVHLCLLFVIVFFLTGYGRNQNTVLLLIVLIITITHSV